MLDLPVLKLEQIERATKEFFKPKEDTRVRDVVREAGQKVGGTLREFGQFDMRIAAATAGFLGGKVRDLGQRVLAGIDPTKTLEEIKQETGFKTTLTPTGTFQEELFGTKEEITFGSIGRELRAPFSRKEIEEMEESKIDPILGGLLGFAALTTGGGATKIPKAVNLSNEVFTRIVAKYGPKTAQMIDELGDHDFALSSLIRGSEETVANRLGLDVVKLTARKVADSFGFLAKAAQETELLRSPERAKRAGQVARTLSGGEGEQSFRSAIRTLEGELPRATIKQTFVTTDDVDILLNHLKTLDAISPFEKINTYRALQKAVGDPFMKGALPTVREIELLRRAFGDELAQAIAKQTRPITDLIADIANFPRSLMASFDFSAPLRQGVVLMVERPKEFVNAFKEQFRYFFDEKYFNASMQAIRNNRIHELRVASKLELTDVTGQSVRLFQKEEMFQSNLAERLPIIGTIVKASERAFAGFLNKLRADTFDSVAKEILSSGLSKEERNRELLGLARFINHATGRGELFGKLQQAGPVLGIALFSPRLLASRFQLLNPVFYYQLPPRARKMAMKAVVKTIAALSSAAALASFSDNADVSTDPKSTDFGKIRVDDTRYDIFGGFQQWAVLYSRLASGELTTSSGEIQELSGDNFPFQTRADVLGRFFTNKLAPTPSLVLDLLRGQNAIGEELTINNTVFSRLIPFSIQDFYEIMEEEGLLKATVKIPPVVFGVGVQVYEDAGDTGAFGLPRLPSLPSFPRI